MGGDELRGELTAFAALALARERGGETSGPEAAAVTPSLRGVVQEMQASGVPRFEWSLLQPLLAALLATELEGFRAEFPSTAPNAGEYEGHKRRLLSALGLFSAAPFTLQRLCELILEPRKYYTSVKKLLFGLEKLLSVSSVLEVEVEVEVEAGAVALAEVSDSAMETETAKEEEPEERAENGKDSSENMTQGDKGTDAAMTDD